MLPAFLCLRCHQDSDSVQCIWADHHYEPTAVLATRDALEAGCDIDSGNTYIDSVPDAVTSGLLNVSYIQAALTRSLNIRFKLGLFDPKVRCMCCA
jgi:beta-glucosidase-like glycosyl hydrolase